MTQTYPTLLDHAIGAAVVAVAAIMFAVPFGLILFSPVLTG